MNLLVFYFGSLTNFNILDSILRNRKGAYRNIDTI